MLLRYLEKLRMIFDDIFWGEERSVEMLKGSYCVFCIWICKTSFCRFRYRTYSTILSTFFTRAFDSRMVQEMGTDFDEITIIFLRYYDCGSTRYQSSLLQECARMCVWVGVWVGVYGEVKR